MTNSFGNAWENHFSAPKSTYPAQGLIRLIRGNYPNHSAISVKNKDVLDIGCGDGRNSEFLSSSGAQVTGLEISQKLVDKNSIEVPNVNFIVGRSSDVPAESSTFDVIVAWNSIYYMDSKTSNLEEHFIEAYRLLRPAGRLLMSIPMPSAFIYKDSELIRPEAVIDYVEIKNDPFGVRNGQAMARFKDKSSIQSFIEGMGFLDISIGEESGDWFGLRYDWWIIDCQKP